MRCQCCGEEVKIGQRFCLNCCAPIEYDRATTIQMEHKREERELKRKKEKQRKKIIKGVKVGVSSIAVFVICFIGVNMFINPETKEINLPFAEKEVETNVEAVNTESQIRVPVEIGESCSSNTYEVTYEDVDIIDKSYEKAVLYNIRSGEEYVFVKVSLFNTSYEDAVYSSLYHFMGYCDGREVNQNKSGTLGEGNKFMSIDGLNHRRHKKTGYICYSLPEGWKELEINMNIDGLDNEPVLIVENPKNRNISDTEIEYIIENAEIWDFMYDNSLRYVSDEDLATYITDFMHTNCISQTDFIPHAELKQYIAERAK